MPQLLKRRLPALIDRHLTGHLTGGAGQSRYTCYSRANMRVMHEYADNGVRLGWLIDPLERRIYELRPGQSVVTRLNPTELRGDPELRGFMPDLTQIW